MVRAIRSNRSTFDDPWGLVALFMAAEGTADASATVVSPKFTLSLPLVRSGTISAAAAMPLSETARTPRAIVA